MRLFFLSLCTLITCLGHASDIEWDLPPTVLQSPMTNPMQYSAAINDSNNGVAVWGDNGAIWAATLTDGVWSPPLIPLGTKDAVGITSLSNVCMNNNGQAVVVYTNENNPPDLYAKYYSNGAWNDPDEDVFIVTLDAAGYAFQEVALAMNEDGNAVVCYIYNDGMGVATVSAAFGSNGGSSWSPPSFSFDGDLGDRLGFPNACINDFGQALIGWMFLDSSSGEFTAQGATEVFDGTTWPIVDIYGPTANVLSLLKIQLNNGTSAANGQAIAVWVEKDAGTDSVLAKVSSDNGQSWGSEHTFPLANPLTFSLSLNNNNVAIVPILDNVGDITSFRWDGTTWDSGQFIGDAAPVIFSAINDAGGAIVSFFDVGGDGKFLYSDDGGLTWYPVQQVAPETGFRGPFVALNEQNQAVAVWPSFSLEFLGLSGFAEPPFTGSGERVVVKALLQKIISNKLTWDSVPGAILYKVYGDVGLTKLLYQTTETEFVDPNINQNQTQEYFVIFIDSEGNPSSSIKITVPELNGAG